MRALPCRLRANQVQYGTWISKCIARRSANPSAECPDQYWNGGPHPAMIADLLGEWTGVALSKYGVERHLDDTRAQHVG